MADYDFNLRGALRVRLQNASEREAGMVERQLGPIQVPVEGEPDLFIAFVDRLPEPPELRFIGLNDAAYIDTDLEQSFYILKGKNKARVKVSIPFHQIDRPMTIACERGLSSIPLLVPLINMLLLSKGILALHASAFSYQGQGALITGWAKGGKTEILLAFTSEGASYVGDEWIYLPAANGDSSDNSQAVSSLSPGSMFGIPEPIRVWNWHLDSLPHYRARLKRKDQLRLQSLSALSGSMQWLAGPNSGRRGAAARVAQRLRPVVDRQLFAHFPPQVLFGAEHCQESASLDQIFFTVSHNSDEIRVEAIDPNEISRRMLHSIAEEQNVLLSYYRKFRFAFPEKGNPWLDNLERIQQKHLLRVLNELPAFAVYHPYPVHIPRLFDALEPYFTKSTTKHSQQERVAATEI
jgi:hypothetical protein